MELHHPALKKSSGWMWSNRLRDANAARWAGYRTLSEFEALDKDDRLDVVARYEIDWRYNVVNSYEQAQEIQRKAKRPKKR